MQRNIERETKIADAWKSGRYKSYSSLARVFKVDPKTVQRAVQRLCDQTLWIANVVR